MNITTGLTNEIRRQALILFLDEGLEEDDVDIEENSWQDYPTLSIGRREYIVLTDEEADQALKEDIEQSVWAFNAEWLMNFLDLPQELAPAIQAFQQDKCESANEALLALVERLSSVDDLAEAAAREDGRGHFLSGYDGAENEIKVWIDITEEKMYTEEPDYEALAEERGDEGVQVEGTWLYIYRIN